MDICLATKKDSLQIAKIHKQEINQGFLSQLGETFLSKLYKAMILSPDAFIIITKKNNKIIGFISGCIDVKKFYKYFLKKHFIQVLIILFPKMFKLSTFKKILETLKYLSKEKKQKLPGAELLTIAVLNEFHGKNIAVKLFEKFLDEMKKRKIKELKVIVGESLPRAIAFYKKIGFKFHLNIAIHQNNLSRIYIYTIK